MRNLLIALPLLAALSACGLTSTALDTTRTPVDGSAQNYDRIEGALKTLGWQYKRSPSEWDYTFEIWPMKGERIRMTSHAETNEIAYVCDGDKLDDDDRCMAEMNKIYKLAFDMVLVDD